MPTTAPTHCDSIPCPGTDNPVINFSSENPDPAFGNGFLGVAFPPAPSDPNGPPGDPGTHAWRAKGCIADCVSQASQEDADLCAARQAYLCQNEPGDGPTDTPGNGPAPTPYFSNEATCSSRCPDGLTFSFTVPHGTFVASSQVLADRQALSYACRQARLHRVCVSALEPAQACNNSSYNGTITASGIFLDPVANAWDITSGSLPPGLDLPGLGGPIVNVTGTPTVQGVFNFTVRVTAPNGDFMEKPLTLCVIDITSIPAGSTPDSLPDATLNSPYGVTLTVPACAPAPVSYQITDGALPAGLTLNESTGIIAGIPTSGPASFVFTVTAQTQAT